MGVYTKTGDDGTTGLAGTKRRIPKDHPRIQAIGAVDELSANLGLAAAHAAADEDLAELINTLQKGLFVLGADLATPVEAKLSTHRVSRVMVRELERTIDGLESDLPPQRNFTLPGGTPCAAHLHLSRTVCRRAEREMTALCRLETCDQAPAAYLNRLGDLLYVLARWANHRAGGVEVPWLGGPVE